MTSAQPETCGCLLIGGQRYQPQTCDACGGSFKINCLACGNAKMVYPRCPHQSGGRSLQISSSPGSGSGRGYPRGSMGGTPHRQGRPTTSR